MYKDVGIEATACAHSTDTVRNPLKYAYALRESIDYEELLLMMSCVSCVTAAKVLDREGNRSRENHSAEEAEDEEEGGHHSSHRLMLSNHVTATYNKRTATLIKART